MKGRSRRSNRRLLRDLEWLRRIYSEAVKAGVTELTIDDGRAFNFYMRRVPISTPPPNQTEEETEREDSTDQNRYVLVALLDGVLYRRPDPNSSCFVEEGDFVTAKQHVCIVEAMKVLNYHEAEVNGRVVRILVEDGKEVKAGTPLMIIDRSAEPPTSLSQLGY